MRSPYTYTGVSFLEVLDAAKCADVVLCVVGPHASLEDGWDFFPHETELLRGSGYLVTGYMYIDVYRFITLVRGHITHL